MWYLLIGLLVFIVIGYIGNKVQSPLFSLPAKFKDKPQFEKNHIGKVGGFVSGKYLYGHPEIDNPISDTQIFSEGNSLNILAGRYLIDKPKKVSEIPLGAIKNVSIEDASMFEKRISAGRVATNGILVLAAKKTVKNEIAYLTIYWNDGGFDHETAFEISGNNAVGLANTARNGILKLIPSKS